MLWSGLPLILYQISTSLQNAKFCAVSILQSLSACRLSSTNATQFVAGYDSIITCPADNGGSLMTSTNNTWTCSGIIIGGSKAYYSVGIYTWVNSYNDFIETAMIY